MKRFNCLNSVTFMEGPNHLSAAIVDPLAAARRFRLGDSIACCLSYIMYCKQLSSSDFACSRVCVVKEPYAARRVNDSYLPCVGILGLN
jgi:hypothetical protein